MTDAALILRALNEACRAGGFAVEITLDLAWIYLHAEGFKRESFGDARQRESRLGKWIYEASAPALVEEAKRLLPILHGGALSAAKFTNLANYPRRPPRIYAYCLDRDPAVRSALEGLGWELRWKFDYETHGLKPPRAGN